MVKIRSTALAIAAAFACSAAWLMPAYAGTYRITRLGVNMLPTAINDAGQIAGDVSDSSPSSVFVLNRGAATVFTAPDPGASRVHLAAINAQGLTVGSYVSGKMVFSGFTYDISTGRQAPVTVDHASGVTPVAINRSGTVTGDGNGGKIFIASSSGARLIRGLPNEDLRASSITNSGTIAGVYGHQHVGMAGFIHKSGVYTTISPPGASRVSSMGINNAGIVFGTYYTGVGQHGFVKIDNTYASFDFPGAMTTSVIGVTKAGLVIGNFASDAQSAGFVWYQGSYFPLAVSGFETQLTAINAEGDIVGLFYNTKNGTTVGFVAKCPPGDIYCTN